MKVTVPTSWSDITLKQFQRYLTAAQGEGLEAVTGAVCALADIDMPTARRIPLSELYRLYEAVVAAMPEGQRHPLHHIIKIGGRDYGFHPDLLGMTLGEFIDLSSLDPGFWPTAHKALAILYRPVTRQKGDRYRVEDYRADHLDAAPQFLDLDMATVMGATSFFLSFLTELPETLMTYSADLLALVEAEVAAGTGLSTTLPTRT